MDELGFSCGTLRDGRLCFVRDHDDGHGFGLAVVCDWLHPLRPPSVYAEGDVAVLQRIPTLLDGSLDLLCAAAVWEPRLAAATVVEWFEARAEILARALEPAPDDVAKQAPRGS